MRALVGAGRIHDGTQRGSAGTGARTIVIKDGLIERLGPDSDGAAPATETLDVSRLAARTLITPAFVDAHLHAVQAGQIARGLDLHGVSSRMDLLDRLAAHVRSRPEVAIVVGQGWDDRSWPDPRPPTRTELDRAADGRLVYLARVDVHSAVVSTALLDQLPEVTAALGYRPDGWVSREAHHLCRGALDRFTDDAERRAAARDTVRRCAALGVGSLHDLGGPHLGPVSDAVRVREAGEEIGPEVVGYWGELAGEQSLALVRAHRLRGLAGDLCIDGAIGSRTAALLDDYSDDPSRGARYLTDDEIRDHVISCTEAGLQAGFHCIGDDGVGAAVQGLRSAAERLGREALRSASHRLEHVEMIAATDFAALSDFGVVASVQPGFDAAWGTHGELYESRLGTARSGAMNPFGGLHRAGVTLAFGTDAPVTPLAGWAMVQQAAEHSRSEQRLSLAEAFAAATVGGHRAAGDLTTGVLAPGRRALLAVWDVTEVAADQFDASGLPYPEPGHEPRCLALVIGNRLVVAGSDDHPE